MNLSSLWQYECERVAKLLDNETQTFKDIFDDDLQSCHTELSLTPSGSSAEADGKLSPAQKRFIDLCTIPRIPEHMLESISSLNEFTMEYAEISAKNAHIPTSQAAMNEQSELDEKEYKCMNFDTKRIKELEVGTLQCRRKGNEEASIAGQRRAFGINRGTKHLEMSRAHGNKVLRLSKIKSKSQSKLVGTPLKTLKVGKDVPLTSKPDIIHSNSESFLNHSSESITPQHCRTLIRSYSGDIFGTRGEYVEGMLYMSRMHKSDLDVTGNDQEKNLKETKLSSLADNRTLKQVFISAFSATSSDANSVPHALHKTNPKSTLAEPNTDRSIDNSPDRRHIKRLQQCAIALKNWSGNPQNAQVMMHENAVEALLRLCQLSHGATTEHLTTSDIAHYQEKNRIEYSLHTLSLCVSALINMSYVKEVRAYMIAKATARVIGEIASTVQDNQIQRSCAVILCNLCAVDHLESHAQLIAEGITNTLYYLISEINMKSHIPTLALFNLTCVEESFTKLDVVLNTLLNVVSTEFVTTLVDGQLGTKPHVDARCILLVKGMCNLSNFRTMRQRLMEQGAMTAVSNLAQSFLVECHHMLAYVLQNLSTLKSYRALMVTGGSLDIIKAFMRNQRQQTTFKNYRVELELKLFLAMTLYNLSRDQSNHSRMIQDGIVNEILTICDAEKFPVDEDHGWMAAQLVYLSAAMLYNISCNKTTRLQLVENQVIFIASKLFDIQQTHSSTPFDKSTSCSYGRSVLDTETIHMCTFTLCNLLTVPQATATASSAHIGAIHSVIEMSYTASTLQTRYLVATALRQLCCGSHTQETVAKSGVVEALICLCYPSAKESVPSSPINTTVMLDGNLPDHESAVLKSIQIQCVAAVTSLMLGTDSSDAVVTHVGPIIRFLTQLLDLEHTNEVLVKLACLCLSLLSREDASADFLFQEQTIGVIIQNTLSSEDTEAKAAYCHILACISRHKVVGLILLESGILKLVSGVARLKVIEENQDRNRDKSTLQRYCSIILANLARNPQSCIAMLSSQKSIHSVMEILPILSINCYSEEIQSNIVNVVAHLSSVTNSEEHLVEMRAVDLLMTIAMVRSLNSATRQTCLAALCNLITSNTISTLIREGMVDLIPQFIAFDNIECIWMVTYIVEQMVSHAVDTSNDYSFFRSASLRAFLAMIVRSSSMEDVNLCVTHEHLLLSLLEVSEAQIDTLVPSIVDAVDALSARLMECVDEMVASWERLSLVMHLLISNPKRRNAAFNEVSVSILMRFLSSINEIGSTSTDVPPFVVYAAGTLSYFAADSNMIGGLKSETLFQTLAELLERMIKSLDVQEDGSSRWLLNGLSHVLFSMCCLAYKDEESRESPLAEAIDLLGMMERIVSFGRHDNALIALVCILTRKIIHYKRFLAKRSSTAKDWSRGLSQFDMVSLLCHLCEAAYSDLESALDCSEIICDIVFGVDAIVSPFIVQEASFIQEQLVHSTALKAVSLLMMKTQLVETRYRCVSSIAALSSYDALRSGLIRFEAIRMISDQALLYTAEAIGSTSIARDIMALCAVTIFNLINSSNFAADAEAAPTMISQGAITALTHISGILGSEDELIATICTTSLSNLSNGSSLIENGAIEALVISALDSSNTNSSNGVKIQSSLRYSLKITRPESRFSVKFKDLVHPPRYSTPPKWRCKSTSYKRHCNLQITMSLPPQGLLHLHKSLEENLIEVTSKTNSLSPVRDFMRNVKKPQSVQHDQMPVLNFSQMDVWEYELQIKRDDHSYSSNTIIPFTEHMESSLAIDEQSIASIAPTDNKIIGMETLATKSHLESPDTNPKKGIRLRKLTRRENLERIEETVKDKQNAHRKLSVRHNGRK